MSSGACLLAVTSCWAVEVSPGEVDPVLLCNPIQTWLPASVRGERPLTSPMPPMYPWSPTDLYWLAVSFKVVAHTLPLYNPGLWGRGLSVHAITRSYQARKSPEPLFIAGLDGPSFRAIGGP